ncbi:hypothetical protein GGR56DRAFT_639350 [Xylariaceae sp. FL0804]|nr:hypothetical protein GGR56DRAFT_639350 [Xylariaceae sp. FL0804]
MQYTLALASALMGLAAAAPQGVTTELTPTGAAPASCTGTYSGNFEISVAKVTETKKRDLSKREACGSEGTLVLALSDGQLTDAQGRTGYIAANNQFQFDEPAQTGAIFNAGFSVCSDSELALGSSKTWYECKSGDFYNLYNTNWAPQCEAVSILAVPCGGADTSAVPDGQVIGTSIMTTTIVTALTDGQPQVVTTTAPVPICQISDGQVQASTPCASITPTSSPVVVSEHSDGQPQVTPPGAVSTIPASVLTSSSPAALSTAPAPTAPANSTASVSSPSTSATASPSPVTGASAHVAVGSVGALLAGLVVAFACL